MPKKKSFRLQVKQLGPIREADITFGDLTVIVGPQATGKSILLQTLKLLLDRDAIHRTFARHNVSFNGNSKAFVGGYFGKGMDSAWQEGKSALTFNGRDYALFDLAKPSKSRQVEEKLFFIPAQRVMSIANGVTQNFGQFNYGDPYTLRAFSDTVHDLLQNEFGAKAELFPQPNRLNDTLRRPITQHVFGASKLGVDARDFTKRLVLNVPRHTEGLPYTAWSAGQREFTPLLLGLYWLCPGGGISRREQIEWVVVEEPEMGLHPQAIEATLLLVLELLKRGYRVVLSTHSPVVLDMVWALQQFKRLLASESDVRDLLGLNAAPYACELAQAALDKDYRVYFFNRDDAAVDISQLDPGAVQVGESQWGGLLGFASRAGDAVANLVNRQSLAKHTKTNIEKKRVQSPAQSSDKKSGDDR